MAKTLGGFNKEFWLVNAIQFFDGLSYFSVIIILSMFLTDNVGFSDYEAGAWQGYFFLFITAFMFTVGSICDVIGDKKSFIFATILLMISRLGMGVFPGLMEGKVLQYSIGGLLFIMALGTAMLVTITSTALRHFTNKDNRGKGFNLYYLIMNIGAMLAGVAVCDGFRNALGPVKGNLAIFTFGFVMSAVCFLCAFLINEDNMEEKDEDNGSGEVKTPLKIFAEVWKETAFQKLVLFLCLTLGVRLVFTHQTMVMPKYYLRTMFADFQLGAVNSLNPLIITVGLALTMNFIGKFNIVKLLVVGMTLSALSLLFLAFPGEWFLAIPGINNLDQAYRFVIIAQILVFAVGELIFSPRFTEYVASVAPKDKVASYMGLSALPMFIARPINGFVSGLLIASLCYDGVKAKIETGNIEYLESPEFMWMIYFALAIISPIAVVALKRTLTQDNTEAAPAEAPKEEAKAEA
jgi:MFS family permease